MTIHVCEQKPWLRLVLSKLRDVRTQRSEFRRFSNLIGEYLVIEAVNNGFVPVIENTELRTPTGCSVPGTFLAHEKSILAVSVVRAGNEFVESVLRLLSPEIEIGQLVIQRDETTALPIKLLEKLPSHISQAACVLVLDPMLATGGSILSAIQVLMDQGVEESRIVLLHALGCPEGIRAIQERFPNVNAVIGVVDSHLNERKFIIPGLGDFGDRFYCD